VRVSRRDQILGHRERREIFVGLARFALLPRARSVTAWVRRGSFAGFAGFAFFIVIAA